MLIAAAHRLPHGRAVGVDIWNTGDQSGNSIEVTRRNAELEGVANRVQLETADIGDLPFHEGSFDAVVSSLVLHNIHSHDGRGRALAVLESVPQVVVTLGAGGALFERRPWRRAGRSLTQRGGLARQPISVERLGASTSIPTRAEMEARFAEWYGR